MASKQSVGIKETLTSLTIAFMMAFVFRGFVIEGFIIPTGSMAPTLLGKHVRFHSPYNGYDWTTGPWQYAAGQPLSRQGAAGATGEANGPLTPIDPITLLPMSPETGRRLAAGDRVFVLKYLPGVHSPSRWDVVVFKNPGTHENYIKRLVGLPGEQLAMVDGDVFTRDFDPGTDATSGPAAWEQSNWAIARKPERTQRTMLQEVFDSRFTPVTPEPSYRPPFSADSPGSWSGLQDNTEWSYTGSGATTLFWNNRRPITDAYPYNMTNPRARVDILPDDLHARGGAPFPVSDLALTVAVEPTGQPGTVTPTIDARGYTFQGVIDPVTKTASVRMRPDSAGAEWTVLDSVPFSGLKTGKITTVEFWHVDQALWLFADGRLIAGGAEKGGYTLTPAQRADAAMIPSWDELVANDSSGDGVTGPGVFARTEQYRAPAVRCEFGGGPFTLHRVRLQRDIHYQPRPFVNGAPTRGMHFNNFPTLTNEQFFMCGDNSPNSEDSRFWTESAINPWVRAMIDPTPGAVNRDLIVGKAFVVYFPAPLDGGPLLAPDLGRVRWIW